MTTAEALDLVVARTGHQRYRDLCDPSHPDHDPGYIEYVLALAEGKSPDESPAPDAPPASMSRSDEIRDHRLLTALAKTCPYRENTSSCGCGVSICHASLGPSRIDPKAVSLDDCVQCVSALVTLST